LIRELTGWQPKYNIREGLKETIEWFMSAENIKKYKANLYNL
jgi:nucleoside-diphosphate-sugar epimerase